jgi:DNA-binding transcriptional regulator YiaG
MTYTQTVISGVIISLKALRKQYGMSQKVLAKLMSVDQTTVSKWEHNRQKPTRAAVLRMAEIFNIDYADMDRTFI